MFKNFFIFVFVLISFVTVFGQDSQLGSRDTGARTLQGGFFDYSDPEAINIKVSIWGFVNFPGKYIVPSYTTITDLISYAGGPNENAELDEIKLYRYKEDGREELINLNYSNLMWENNISQNRNRAELLASDVLIIPGTDRLYFNDYLSMGLSIFSALVSLAILILTVN